MARKKQAPQPFRDTCQITLHGHLWTARVVADDLVQELYKKDNLDALTIAPKGVRGFCDADERSIVVSTSLLGKPGFCDTLFHEVYHAILSDLTRMPEYDEELVVEMLGRELPNLIMQVALMPKEWFVGTSLERK
jgi:hypothetical protein